ncbi:thiamine ABC transporter ATP-binding protein ThiQ [Morganella sp. Je.2.23]|uniref:thiamine ABC transporter ATP-binding protein ThiQ n=1 Tax=Morganella sp. Je.2.23 TaxID=3142840 RepID=UPI003DA8F91C
MIYFDHIHYRYQQQTMNFDFSVTAGEKIAILGPSGAGKSTLLSLIAGFQFAESGTIRLNGEDHTRTPPARRPVSMLFQENNLFAHLTAEQNIALGFHPGMKLNAAQKVQLEHIAEQVSLTPLLRRLPSQLSGGQRQRVALARCLVRSQPVLLLDEPFSALDPALRNEMLTLLETICEERQLTLMMVSHNTDDAARIAPRAMVVDNGTIAFDGSTAALVSGNVPQAQILGIRPQTAP